MLVSKIHQFEFFVILRHIPKYCDLPKNHQSCTIQPEDRTYVNVLRETNGSENILDYKTPCINLFYFPEESIESSGRHSHLSLYIFLPQYIMIIRLYIPTTIYNDNQTIYFYHNI